DGDAENPVSLQAAILQRIRFIARLVQVARAKAVRVDNQDAARLEVFEVRLEGGRVHRHQGVEPIARCVDIRATEMDLKAGDAGQGAGRGANFGRKVGQGADVVAQDGGGVGELGTGQLHAVTRVAAKPNRHRFKLLHRGTSGRGSRLGRRVRHGHIYQSSGEW